MPEFLEKRYNKESRTILSVISLISYVLTKVAVTVYAGGLVFQQVFGIKELWGIDFFLDCCNWTGINNSSIHYFRRNEKRVVHICTAKPLSYY